MAQDPVSDYLRKTPTSPAQRAELWDVYESAADEDDLATKLQGLRVPEAVKAQLWDLKSAQRPVAPSIPSAPAAPPETPNQFGDALIGFGKGAANTAVNLGRLVHKIPGVDAVLGDIPEDAGNSLGLEPTNSAQRFGLGVEQIAEFMIPAAGAERVAASVAAKVGSKLFNAPRFVQTTAKVAPKLAAQGVAAGGVTAAQGGDAARGAGFGVAGEALAGTTGAAGRAVGKLAAPMVRTAIKPTVTAMKRIAGGAAQGLDAKASSLVNFIIDKRITSAEQARTLITQAERELQRVLAGAHNATDAPTRALRYLTALEKSAARQGLPKEDVAIIRNAAAEVLEGKLGADEITMVLTPHPTLIKPDGKPFMVMTPDVKRVPRNDVMPDEAMSLARANSKWSTKKQWGEQKGASMEASKTIERAERDAVKDAVPEARPILAGYSKAIQSADVLDRMAFRQGSREAVSLPAQVMGVVEMTSGKLPLMAAASNWLRNEGLKGGIWADRLSKAVQRNDVTEVATILNRLGVGAAAQSAKP